ncbi:MAG: hypothetical protein VYD85_20555 [Pseudomonadota bacterium]|nr:hypothetical protein [Pseudomonadota bacterium]
MTSDATPALHWGHINVNVSDLDRSIVFYETLGFEVYRPAIPYLNLEMTGTRNTMAAGATRALGVPASFRSRGCVMKQGRGFPKLDLIEVADGARGHRSRMPIRVSPAFACRQTIWMRSMRTSRQRAWNS